MRQDQQVLDFLVRPFVLLRHELPATSAIASHWDLMIQSGDRLATWQLSSDLCLTPRQTVEQIGDHRLAYLDFQGPVSNDRGTVCQIARGEFHVHRWTDNEIDGELRMLTGITTLRLTRQGDSTVWNLGTAMPKVNTEISNNKS